MHRHKQYYQGRKEGRNSTGKVGRLTRELFRRVYHTDGDVDTGKERAAEHVEGIKGARKSEKNITPGNVKYKNHAQKKQLQN